MNHESFSQSPPILIVDDDKDFLEAVEHSLRDNGLTNVHCCQDSRNVMPLLEKKKYSLILLDMRMPGLNGEELLPQIVENYPEIPVIVVTAYGRTEIAVECMKAGAFDYLEKPFEPKMLLEKVQAAIIFFSEIKTRSKLMYYIFQRIRVIAKKKKPILITGETGVGKDLIANAIHKVSQREGDFVKVNIAGREDNLLSNELFGHKKGAFTDAREDRKGLIEEARGGTLFLNEIGDLSIQAQVKLLRLIEDGKYYQLGADKPLKADARIIAATNKDVKKSIKNEKFREDLYHRFYINICIPPLRERKEDIPVLVNHFLEMASKESDTQDIPQKEEVLKIISNYDFPGNVRELRNMIFDMVDRHQFRNIQTEVFNEQFSPGSNENKIDWGKPMPTLDKFETIFSEFEALYFQEVLKRSGGNKSEAAKLAGLDRKTLEYRLKKMNNKLRGKRKNFTEYTNLLGAFKKLIG